jgi:flavin reductase (DIM6/NTAB) family NADH-FMN oxidoreductase RutF
MIDERGFRNALGRFATGVTVVTMRSHGRDYGLTVNAFMSVSLDPPLVAICVDKGSPAHETLLRGERYGVSILSEGQQDVSDYFAGRASIVVEPFGSFQGFPVIEGSQADIVCRILAAHEAGDHTIFVGQVERLRYADGGMPLLYYRGRYRQTQEPALVEG